MHNIPNVPPIQTAYSCISYIQNISRNRLEMKHTYTHAHTHTQTHNTHTNPALHVKHTYVRIVYTYPYTRKFEVMQINHINLRFVSSILSQFLLYDGLFYPIAIRMHKTSIPFSDSVWSKIVKIRGELTSRYIHVMCISLLSTYRDMEWDFENLSNRKN